MQHRFYYQYMYICTNYQMPVAYFATSLTIYIAKNADDKANFVPVVVHQNLIFMRLGGRVLLIAGISYDRVTT